MSTRSSEGAPGSARRRAPSLRIRLLVTLAAPLLGFLCVEAGLRLVLFHGGARFWEGAAVFADATRYAARRTASEEDFWRLSARITDPADYWRPLPEHPRLGWLGAAVDPETYAHEDEPLVGEARPVLLFGSSFVRCAPPVSVCHGDLLASSPLGERYRILNYSVSAYGFGQILLLVEAALEHHRASDPVVVVAVQCDQVFDRMVHEIRQGPKPRFRLGPDGELEEVPVEETHIYRYLTHNPVRIRSYAWNHLLYGTELLPGSWRARFNGRQRVEREKRELVPAALARLARALEGTEAFLLLLASRTTVQEGGALTGGPEPPTDWRHSVGEQARALGLPVVSAVPTLRAALDRPGGSLDELFLDNGHPSDAGVRLQHEALVRGLMREYDG